MKTPDEYREWLEAAASSEEGALNTGIGIGTLILIILLVAILF